MGTYKRSGGSHSPGGHEHSQISANGGRDEAARTARRREPRQARAKETFAAILEAAAELFNDLGYARATTNRIAARAGVSIGSLYQYFPDKDALLRALFERHLHAVHRVVDSALSELADPDVPLEVGLRSLLEKLVELHAGEPALNRVIAQNTPGFSEHAGHGDETDRYVREVEKVLRQRPDVRVTDTTVAAFVVARTIESLMRWLAHEAPERLDPRAFVDETLAMLLGYLSRGLSPDGTTSR